MQTKHYERNLHQGLNASNREILSLLKLLGPFLHNDSWQLPSRK